MERFVATPADAADAAGVAEVVGALEWSFYGRRAFSQADLEDEWSDVDLEQNTRVVYDGDRLVGYGAVRERGELCMVEGFVHPDALGRGIGKLIANWLEERARSCGAHRIHSTMFEADAAGRSLLASLGYRHVRVFRELRIELEQPPLLPQWPQGLRAVPFDPRNDALEFHAAQEEAFSDHWEYIPRDFEAWSREHLESERFDATLWCVVRAGNEIVAGTVCTADTYGGGWIWALFTRRRWRRKGVGTALLRDAFGRFWERGEHSVGLGVDAANESGAFRVYERAGMAQALALAVYEKELRAEPA